MNYLQILLMLLSSNMQEKQNPLINTKWEYKVTEGCISYVAFQADSIYEDYSCERNYLFLGKYHVKNDTVYLIEIDLESNVPSENEKNNYKKVIKGRSKYLLKGRYIQYVTWEGYEEGKWTDIVLPQNEIFYKKVEK